MSRSSVRFQQTDAFASDFNEIRACSSNAGAASTCIKEALEKFAEHPAPRGNSVASFQSEDRSKSWIEYQSLIEVAGIEAFKIRCQDSSSQRSARKGFRLIVLYDKPRGIIFLLRIYDKLNQEDIEPSQLLEPMREVRAYLETHYSIQTHERTATQ